MQMKMNVNASAIIFCRVMSSFEMDWITRKNDMKRAQETQITESYA